MNQFIAGQCRNMLNTVNLFKQSCEMAAKRDDGKISKDEEKTLSRIKKATDSFTKEIERILEKGE